jgi:nucleoside-triphosphatase
LKKSNLNPGGFMVGREGDNFEWSSFYLLPAETCLRDDCKRTETLCKYRAFAVRSEDGTWEIDNNIFNNYGVKLLTNTKGKDIIVMDELGRFEREALIFQKKVFEILQKEIPVIGVIKAESNPFLNRVRNSLASSPLVVTRSNREIIYDDAKKKVKKLLGREQVNNSESHNLNKNN